LARSPPGQDGRKVRQLAGGSFRLGRFAVVGVPSATVLIREVAPAEVRCGSAGMIPMMIPLSGSS
jgi:hypothetical protein